MSNTEFKRESVWDYPRPPAVVPDTRLVTVLNGDQVLASTTNSLRVLETSHPPVFYLPPADVDMEVLRLNRHHTFCEYKGRASYYDLASPHASTRNVAWTYPDPAAGYESLKDMVAFYPAKVDCFVADETVHTQEGDFYGGWITSEIVGPFKGGPGTLGW